MNSTGQPSFAAAAPSRAPAVHTSAPAMMPAVSVYLDAWRVFAALAGPEVLRHLPVSLNGVAAWWLRMRSASGRLAATVTLLHRFTEGGRLAWREMFLSWPSRAAMAKATR